MANGPTETGVLELNVRHVPGGEATVTLKTTDDDGKPVGALVGVTVTDDSVLEMIEKREQAPRLPGHIVLSEPLDDCSEHWRPVPESSFVAVRRGRIDIRDFRPSA